MKKTWGKPLPEAGKTWGKPSQKPDREHWSLMRNTTESGEDRGALPPLPHLIAQGRLDRTTEGSDTRRRLNWMGRETVEGEKRFLRRKFVSRK